MSDILAEIDCAISCYRCTAPLGDSPSDDFCRPECQEGWHAERSFELVGYRPNPDTWRLAWDGINQAMTAAAGSFTALAGFMAVELPDDPRERPLVARRARGTGPTLASRPPKHIGRPSRRGSRVR